MPRDHDVPGGVPSAPAPLADTEPGRAPSAAEQARTLVAATNIGALATLTAKGDPWSSLVAYGALADGSPVLSLSRLAEHGRNLASDGRASLMVSGPVAGDPLATARVTLAGLAERRDGDAAARDALLDAVAAAATFVDFGDFTLWALRVDRVRWVGGYGRMAGADGADYAAAEPDPVAAQAPAAIAHLNADHADALLAIARKIAGFPDATAAACDGVDRYGLDLLVETPRGTAAARAGFAVPLASAGDLRTAAVELTRRARA